MSTKLSLVTSPAAEASDTYGLSAKDEAWAQANKKPGYGDTDTELEILAEAALAAQKREKDAVLEAKSATAAFRDALEKAGKLHADNKEVGIVRTTIYPTRRFSETLARGIMTKKLQKECEKTVLDTAAVKKNVSPADYERMQETTGMTLRLSLDAEQA